MPIPLILFLCSIGVFGGVFLVYLYFTGYEFPKHSSDVPGFVFYGWCCALLSVPVLNVLALVVALALVGIGLTIAGIAFIGEKLTEYREHAVEKRKNKNEN